MLSVLDWNLFITIDVIHSSYIRPFHISVFSVVTDNHTVHHLVCIVLLHQAETEGQEDHQNLQGKEEDDAQDDGGHI